MKYIAFVILFLLSLYSNAQDRKAYLILSPQFSHYIPVENTNSSQNEDVIYNISPGIELLYNYPLASNSKLATGLSYTYASLISNASGSDKFIFGEISLPVLFTITEKSNRFSVVAGIYAGKFLHFEWYKKAHSQWSKATSYDPRFGYKEQNTFIDLYLAVSYAINKKDPRHASISPFIKYRIGENWMDIYRESFYYGFKFTINLNKLNKEDKC